MSTPYTMKSYTAIGIDPGFDRIGWSVGQISGSRVSLMAFGCITTRKQDTYFGRLGHLQTELAAIIEEYKPTTAIVELLFFAKNQTTAIPVAQARGIILGELIRHSVEVVELTPAQIKQRVTGSGAATKKEMEKMVRLQLKLLPDVAIIDDAIDAIGALIALQSRTLP